MSKPWLLLQSGAGDPAWNMAFDEALLEASPGLSRPVLRFYSWSEPCATFGYSQHFRELERVTSLRPLIRRPTGGGLVPHEADWTYSLVFPPDHSWYTLKATESYERVHQWIKDAFEKFGITTELSTSGGTSDGRFIADICPQVLELGPLNATIHKLNECVAVADLDILSEIYCATLVNLLVNKA